MGANGDAPYVNPFRYPSAHAQHLRALEFAKARNARVLWTVAHDEIVADTFRARVGDAMEALRQSWLQKPYQETGNIPGLLPLVRDLPVRFTDTPDREAREKYVFKNARG